MPLTTTGIKQMFVPYNGKIADIKEADTSKHTLNLATVLGETREIIMAELCAVRVSGTGELRAYPNEGTEYVNLSFGYGRTWTIIIKDGTQRVQYAQSVANDDFDLYCYGYVVEA